MAQKYYNVEETAKIFDVSAEEVKQMLERRELHGYRDGANWKFKSEDIERVAEERKLAPPTSPVEEDVSDVLLSEVELGQSGLGTSGTVIAMDAMARDAAMSDIQMASDINIISHDDKTPTPKMLDESNAVKFGTSDLTLDEELMLAENTGTLPGKPSVDNLNVGESAIDLSGNELEDDDLVLGGSGGGSDLTIGGDSGISLVDPADSGLSLEQPLDLAGTSSASLELDEDDMLTVSDVAEDVEPTQLKTDDDFLLTPLEEAADADESGSGSQVIALDAEMDGSGGLLGAGGAMAAMLDENLSAEPALDLGMGALAGSPLLGGHPSGLSEAAPIQPTVILSEPPYTGLQIAGLATATVLLMLVGMMMYDLLRNMWSWQGSYAVNSSMMDFILGLFGDK